MLKQKYPTVIGYCALIFWALAAPFTVYIKAIPVFETLAVVFTVSFLFSAIKLTLTRQWRQLRQPWFLWVIGFVGIYGNEMLYVAAFKHAPAAQADLINYLWPILVILFTGFLPNEKFSFRHIIAALIGFLGIFILINPNNQGFNSQYLLGYAFAFLGALAWSFYTLAAKCYKNSPVHTIGIYCGLGAISSIFLHFHFEPTVLPSNSQWCILLAMGLTTQNLAYVFWDFGVKKGDFKLLSLLSYGNPIFSIIFLIVFGMAKPSPELFLSCILVSLGGIIGIMPWQRFVHWRARVRSLGLIGETY